MARLRIPIVPVALAVLAALPACVVVPGTARPTTPDELRARGGWLLVEGVPFVAQETGRDCGAASLAMALRHAGVDASPRVLEGECAVEGEPGLRAAALRDAARRRGLAAYAFPGRVEDLEHELSRGRPVVVGLVKSLGPLANAHYQVVVGLHREDGAVAALDPAIGLVSDALPAFLKEWDAANRLTLVVFRPAAATASRRSGDARNEGGGP